MPKPEWTLKVMDDGIIDEDVRAEIAALREADAQFVLRFVLEASLTYLAAESVDDGTGATLSQADAGLRQAILAAAEVLAPRPITAKDLDELERQRRLRGAMARRRGATQ